MTTITPPRRYAYPGPDDTLRATLPNGITVLARENFASPAIIINGYLKAGAVDESASQAGLADLTASVMERGTLTRPFDELYEEVESVGATFGLDAGGHTIALGAKGLAAQLPFLLDVLNDVLRNPAFREAQLQKVRGELLTSLQERVHDTRRMANLLFHELAYPAEHPYHRALSGYPETISALTRLDLLNFHQRNFSPQGMVIAIVGAVKAAEALEAVSQTFGNWEATRPAAQPLPQIRAMEEIRRRELAIPEKTQSDIRLGWVGPARRSPDFMACYLANTILGVFGMMGRLGESVRSQNGLAYYAYSQLSGGSGPGPWRIIAGVNPTNIEQAIQLIIEEVKKLREEPVPAEELADSKSYLLGSLPLHLETNEGVAQILINMERHELGLDYLHRYHDLINNVTAEEIQEVAQRWLDPAHYAVGIAGPKNK